MIPSYVEKLPITVKSGWLKVYDTVEQLSGSSMALIVANNWLLNVKGLVSLEFSLDGGLTKSSDGTTYVDFILTDSGYDDRGYKIEPHVLNEWATAINEQSLVIKGDENHVDYDYLMEMGVSKDRFMSVLKDFKKGFAKSVKAIVDNGKLWIRAAITPGYEELVSNATGISLEAELDFDDNNKRIAIGGKLGGFTFSTGNFKPHNPRAIIDKNSITTHD